MISFKSGTSGYFRLSRCRDRVARGRRRGNLEVLGRDLVPQQSGVGLERFIHLRVGHAHPPGEERVVTVVEGEPFGGDRAQLVDRSRAERRLLPIHPQRCGRQARDLPGDLGERCGGALGVHVLHTDARFDELDELRRERRRRNRLGHRQRLGVEPCEVAGDRGLERVEIRRRCRRELRRIDACDRGLPVRVEALQPGEARGRERYGLGQRGGRPRRCVRASAATATTPAATPAVGVVARERRAIQVVPQHHHPHLALRCGERAA